MDAHELCRELEELIDRANYADDRIDDAWADGSSLVIETSDGQRFRLDVALQGRVGEP